MKWLKVAMAVVLVSGCATSESINRNIQSRYVGQPLDVAIKRLGYPSREMTVAGHKLYIWDSGRTVATPSVVTSGDSNRAPATVWMNQGYACTLKLEVDKNDVVKDYDIDGHTVACEAFGG